MSPRVGIDREKKRVGFEGSPVVRDWQGEKSAKESRKEGYAR
jgi:hypothetical protein